MRCTLSIARESQWGGRWIEREELRPESNVWEKVFEREIDKCRSSFANARVNKEETADSVRRLRMIPPAQCVRRQEKKTMAQTYTGEDRNKTPRYTRSINLSIYREQVTRSERHVGGAGTLDRRTPPAVS